MQPKFFHLRRSPFTGYGFAFRGNRVSALLPGSEAERTGLRIGDRLLQINGQDVTGLSKEAILSLIPNNADVMSLLVLPDGELFHSPL
jgi:C-terminal processing protease CtpA/Prc